MVIASEIALNERNHNFEKIKNHENQIHLTLQTIFIQSIVPVAYLAAMKPLSVSQSNRIVPAIKKAFTLFCLLLTSLFSFAQQAPELSSFTASHQNGKAFLNWTITAGSTCNGINIFRSVDAINFSKVGSIVGICGNLTVEQRYDFTDNNPINNKVNYYRLEFGNFGFSEIISVEIIYTENGSFQIRPNPVSNNARIYFNNDKKETCRLSLFNLLGIPLMQIASKDFFFDIDASNLRAGTYLFTISGAAGSPKAQGRFAVQR